MMDKTKGYGMTRSISDIEREIRRNWRPVNYAARPYLDAMASIQRVTDAYGHDSGVSVVSYFLSNASTWRGDTARRVKAELKAAIASARGAA